MVSSWRIAGSILVTVFLLALAPSALASSTRLGAAPKLPSGTRTLGPVAASATIPVTIVLQPRDPLGLQQYATEVSTPGSSIYRQYLTVSQFAQRFGPTPAAIDSVLASLRAHGLAPGKPTANGLTIPVRASAAALSSAFSLSLQRITLPDGRSAIVNTAAPALDASVAPAVQAVVGLDSLAVAHPGAIPGQASTASKPRVVTGGPQPCAAAIGHGNTADLIATAYSLPGFYGAGDQGAGQTIAIYQLEQTADSDIAAYQACYGTTTVYSKVNSPDGSPTAAPSGESSLDLEDVIGLAPRARVLVYQGCQGATCPSGLVDLWNKIVSDNVAKVVSSSWGLCEPNGSSGLFNAENTIFQEAAAQGQSVFAASGDRGSEDCFGKGGPQTALSVEDPASQPFVTGVGGTHLSALGPPPTESVWNTGPGHASGGGLSARWSMPSYQARAPSSLRVINGNSSGTPCGNSGGFCREVPDVSADADPGTGYAMYVNGNWGAYGGTSASTPTLAAITALINASAGCGGTPIGFANDVLYSVAARAYPTAFNDVMSGNNDTFPLLNGGQFPAGPGYDMASGLGTPNGLNFGAVACNTQPRASFKLTNTKSPGTGQAVRFDGTPSSEPGGRITTYAWKFGDGATATGAKPGHTYRRKGRYTVTLTVTDVKGQRASQHAALFVGRGGKITTVGVQGRMITVKVNGPGTLRIGKRKFRVRRAKGRSVSLIVDSAGKYKITFSPKYGNLQKRKVKVN